MLDEKNKTIIAADKELREVLLYLLRNGPTAEGSLITALQDVYPLSRRSCCDFSSAVFRVAHSLFVKKSEDGILELSDDAKNMLESMDIRFSSCGASIVRTWSRNEPVPTIYCWYCGGLM